MQLLCTQQYLDFVSDMVADSGYVFIVTQHESDGALHTRRSAGTTTGTVDEKHDSAAVNSMKTYLRVLNFGILENKFLCRRGLPKVVGDQDSRLIYYTSMVSCLIQ